MLTSHSKTEFITSRELNRKGSAIIDSTSPNHYFVVNKNGIPRVFIADFAELEQFERFKEWQYLQTLDSEDIMNSIYNRLTSVDIDMESIPSVEDQLQDIL